MCSGIGEGLLVLFTERVNRPTSPSSSEGLVSDGSDGCRSQGDETVATTAHPQFRPLGLTTRSGPRHPKSPSHLLCFSVHSSVERVRSKEHGVCPSQNSGGKQGKNKETPIKPENLW